MTTVKPYQLHAIIKLLIAIGDKLEISGDSHWHIAARAASTLDAILLRQPMTDSAIAQDIDAAAGAMHNAGNADAEIAFLLAGTILDALRIGLATIDRQPAPRWIGIDTAKPGKDTTVTHRGDCHA